MSDPTLERIQRALVQADAAGNADDAAALAKAYRTRQRYLEAFGGKNYVSDQGDGTFTTPDNSDIGAGETAARSFLQGGTVNMGDEIVAALAATGHKLRGDEYVTWKEAYEGYLGRERDRLKAGREQNPGIAIPAEVAGAVGLGGGMASAGATMVGKGSTTLGNMGRGALEGGIYGAAYGFGGGEGGPENRARTAAGGAALGAAAGGLMAGAADRAARLASNYKANRQAAAAGVSPEATRVMGRAIAAEGPENVQRRIAEGGPDAMLADGGEALATQLDTAANASLGGASTARGAVDARAAAANAKMGQVLDDTLGAPQGANKTAREISTSTQRARGDAYTAAYDSPIDYGTGGAGDRILQVVRRIPKRIFDQAVRDANEAMQIAGVENLQILARVADDGTVAFEKMPNVQQLDFLKRALQEMASEADEFGRATQRSSRYRGIATELRHAIAEAAPAYDDAMRAGQDKIARDNALRLGRDMLRPRTSREAVKEAMENAGPAEIRAAKQGVREYLDDAIANVRQIASDPNTEARELRKALSELSSKAARDKMRVILGPQEAATFFRETQRLARSLELKARIARNSATAARQATQREVAEITSPGAIRQLFDVRPVEAARELVRGVTRQTRAAQLEREDGLYREIARVLTERRGIDAVQQVQEIIGALARRDASSAEMIAAVRAFGATPATVGGQAGNDLNRAIGVR